MRNILVLVLILVFSFQVKASHLMGGEITWECLKSGPNVGQYIFTLKVYRDCSGITVSTFTQNIQVWGHSSVTFISADFVLQQDVSPICDPANSGNPNLDCASGNQGAVEEYIFQSIPVTLIGIPPTTGWHFTWDNCCRNNAITNLATSSDGFTLRASMYPYDSDFPNGVYLPADPCFDSSPNFKEQPKTILCVGFPFSYSHNASDAELDDLVYLWGEPLDDNVPLAGGVFNPGVSPSILTFFPPYSVNSPLPGNPTLDAQTGEVNYNANQAGYYVTCVKVEAYKCNQLVAEIFREVQVVLIACPSMPGGAGIPNNPPAVSTPFIDTATTLPSYETTVFAGELVNFNIEGTDGDMYNGVTPQNLTMEVSGGQFSGDYINTSNCLNPPCATFNNGSGITPPFSSPGIVSGVFTWQTACSHIAAISGCGATSNVFTFLVKVYDDFCPANGIKFATIKVTVLPSPIDNAPDVRCVSVLSDGSVDITWEHLASSPPSTVYSIFHSSSPNGPFTFLDSILYPINIYNHPSAGVNSLQQYYYVTSHSSCADESEPSDTLSTIKLTITPINAATVGDLNWNAIHVPSLTTSLANYQVFAKDGNGVFQNVGQSPTTDFLFPAVTCDSNQDMYVSLEDQSGCISQSSIDSAILSDELSPDLPVITDVSVDVNGKAIINWTCSSGDVDMYEINIKDAQGWIPIGIVNAPITTFIYNASNASNTSETFAVRALDSCDNASLRSVEHNSINIETQVNVCDFIVDISWNEYINITDGISHYTIFITETDQFGGITNSTDRLTTEMNFIINNINAGSNYYIYVVAYNTDSTIAATSDQLNEPISLPTQPTFNYIEYASINHDNGFVEINCLIDNQAIIDYYDIFRSLRKEDSFNKIGQTPFSGSTSVHYTDETAKIAEEFYQYQIYPVDTCGVRLSAPPVFSAAYMNDTSFAQTILLQAVINLDYSSNSSLEGEYTNTLSFNEYDKWLGSVVEYRLYRSMNREEFNVLPLHTWDRVNNPTEELKYIDIVTDYGEGNGRFCYYIEAIEGNDNPYGPVLEGSFSNIACVSQTPIIFVPSVFTPNGDEHNEVFRPVTYFVSEIGYSFTIYNREGTALFSTNDPQKGWAGTYLGNMVQNGNYIYHLQFRNGVGNLTEKTAVVTLVR
jgi:gliding motility-associated-like protein